MKLKPIAANQNEIILSNGNILFFSYETPVAAFISGRGIVRTNKKWSNTTTRHIHKFIMRNAPSATISEEPQEFFDGLNN